MISAFFLQFVNYLAFPSVNTPGFLIIGTSIVGFTFGGMLTLFSSITVDYYGMKNFGISYGFVITAWGVGGVLGPLLGGIVRDLIGTYTISYGVSALLNILGVVLALVIKAPKERPVETAVTAQ